MTKKIVWYASGGGVKETGPFDSQVKAWEAMTYSFRPHPSRIHPADTNVWPVEVDVLDEPTDLLAPLRDEIVAFVASRNSPHVRIDTVVVEFDARTSTPAIIRQQVTQLVDEGRLERAVLGERGHYGFVGIPDKKPKPTDNFEKLSAEVEEVRDMVKVVRDRAFAMNDQSTSERMRLMLKALEGVVGFIRKP